MRTQSLDTARPDSTAYSVHQYHPRGTKPNTEKRPLWVGPGIVYRPASSLHSPLEFQIVFRGRMKDHCITVDSHTHPHTLNCKTKLLDTIWGRISLRISGPYHTVSPYFKSSLYLYLYLSLLSFYPPCPLVLLLSWSLNSLLPSSGYCPFSDTTSCRLMEEETGIPRGREGLRSDLPALPDARLAPFLPAISFWRLHSLTRVVICHGDEEILVALHK